MSHIIYLVQQELIICLFRNEPLLKLERETPAGYFHIIFSYILPNFNGFFSIYVCDRKLEGSRS